MSKKTYKLLRFDGGINNDADPRDIADNQFSVLENVAVDEVGKIKLIGDARPAKTSFKDVTGGLSVNGRGFFAFSADYNGFAADSSTEKIYYLIERTGVGIQAEPSDSATSNNAIVANFITPTYYAVDGALRVGDASHASSIAPVWKGYVTAKTYGPDSTNGDADIAAQWDELNAEIAGAFPTFQPSAGDFQNITFCQNAIVANEVDNSSETDSAPAYSLNDGEAAIAGWADGTVAKASSSGMTWGAALEFDENESGTGTWMPSTNTRYKFYITTMYDDHTQESLPQLMQMFPSSLFYNTSGSAEDRKYDGKAVQSEMGFTNGDTFGSGSDIQYAENCAVWFAPVIKVNNGTSTTYNFGASNPDSTSGGNIRMSGVRIYWSSNEDGYSSLWQMFDVKFDEGIKAIGVDGAGGGTGGYAPMKATGTNGFTVDLPVSNKWSNPPRYIQYSAVNGHSHTDTIKVDSYKTAVLANRRVYIGNIKQDGKIYGDRMLKSPVNQFDKFPSVNNIDVAIHDGDEIVELIEYADRILQFKKNTCYIINVSGNTEFLESENKFKGINNPGAACRTDYGVAWVNQNGCYLYDGKQVSDLLEENGMRKINKSIWSTFIGSNSKEIVGFSPSKRQIIVKGDSTDIYLFDMVTKSWAKGTSAICDSLHSNFINSPEDGRLLVFDDTNDDIDDWEDIPSADKSITITTKDIDFGEPAVRKKVYKVYITYKSDTTTLPSVYYDTDGNTTLTTAATATTAFADTNNQWTRAEYKFSSDANSCKSIQLKISGTADTTFEINDITFVYRMKSIK